MFAGQQTTLETGFATPRTIIAVAIGMAVVVAPRLLTVGQSIRPIVAMIAPARILIMRKH